MFSIRWKLTLGLLGLTVLFIGIYVALAKQTFESDKISYVFETQQNQVDAMAETFRRDVEKSLADLKAVAYVAAYGSSSAAQSAFDNEERLVAVDDIKNGQPIYRFEKAKNLLDRVPLPAGALKDAKPEIRAIEGNLFSASAPLPDKMQEWSLLRGVFRLPAVLGEHFETQTVLFTDGTRILAKQGSNAVDDASLARLVQTVLTGGAALTRTEKLGADEYLVSQSRLVYDRFSIWALTPRAEALGALNTLFRKSMFFLGFSFFAAVVIALLLSYTLTRNINRLTDFARRVGQGDFSEKPDFAGSDEVGILARTFGKMMDEIQKLLLETADKARMETELKTARVVQDNLFPKAKEAAAGALRIAGFYTTSTECGGDWWYYFQRGDELQAIVADATGHGTPAALITSAARSVYSVIERDDIPLSEAADLLDSAINGCSAGKLGMTALMLRMNKDSGACSYLSASHEDAVILTPTGSGQFEASFLPAEKSSTLGEARKNWVQNSFVLEPGQRMVVWTDGLTAMAEQSGKSLGERRFLKNFEKIAATARTPNELAEKLFEHFHGLGDRKPLVDDVTLVVIENARHRAL